MSTLIAEYAENTPAAAIINHEFCVGEWLVCPDLNRIQHRRDQSQKQLEPRLVHLLCYLASHPGQVLARDELVRELWPEVIVNENSLTRAISELRKQLSSANSKQVYIETIAKKGYRLIPAIEVVDVAITPDESSLTLSFIARVFVNSLSSGSWRPSSALPSLLLSGVLVTWLTWNAAATNSFMQPATSLLADEVITARTQLFGGKVTLSTATESSSATELLEAPIVSSDGSRYAYISYDNTGSTVFLAVMEENSEPIAIFCSSQKLYNLAWSPVGNGLLFAKKPAMTTTALFSMDHPGAHRNREELILLDLETLSAGRLVQETNPVDSTNSTKLNLT